MRGEQLIIEQGGVRYIEVHQLRFPIYLLSFYKALGFLDNQVEVVTELSSIEQAALDNKHGFTSARSIMKHLIDNFEPFNDEEVETFIHEHEQYLLLLEFNLEEVYSFLASKVSRLNNIPSYTRSSRIYELFQELGIPVRMFPNGNLPKPDRES